LATDRLHAVLGDGRDRRRRRRATGSAKSTIEHAHRREREVG
jgi:hypothetical protein